MDTTLSQIQLAAYFRWERRGGAHGRDHEDWSVAQLQQEFAANYRVIASRKSHDHDSGQGGGRLSNRCRFCQQRIDVPSFSRVVPGSLGSALPRNLDQCEECVTSFAEGIDEGLDRYLSSLVGGTHDPAFGIPVVAFKGLVKAALAILPLRDLEDHEDTIEWITNPDHNFDFRVFSGLSCVVHTMAYFYPSPWAAVAEKTNDRNPWASRLFFLGMDRTSLMISVPLNPRDEDLDLTGESLPEVYPPAPFAWDPHIVERRVEGIRPDKPAARRPAMILPVG